MSGQDGLESGVFDSSSACYIILNVCTLKPFISVICNHRD
jgi:hypothetical protein